MKRQYEAQAKLVRQLLSQHGLTQSECARRLEIHDRTMRRYTSGQDPVPKVILLALRVCP